MSPTLILTALSNEKINTLFDSPGIRQLLEEIRTVEKGEFTISSRNCTGGGLSMESLEALEVRIDLLKQDSRLTSYRIAALEDRRKEIQSQIKALKILAEQLTEPRPGVAQK